MKLFAILVASLMTTQLAVAFAPSTQQSRQAAATTATTTTALQANRRSVLASFLVTAPATIAIASSSQPASAASDGALFKPNPLTNSILEQVRIWDQDFADNVKYSGELESGSAGNKGKVDAYPTLLIPIVKIANDLRQVQSLVQASSSNSRDVDWPKALEIMSKPQYDTLAFKKAFNAYGDNIYYSDPDRANLYLGGGATPKTEQSLAYLLRNDVLNNIQSLQAELVYLLKPSTSTDESSDDLRLYAQTAVTAMDRYLELVPPNELKAAQELMANE